MEFAKAVHIFKIVFLAIKPIVYHMIRTKTNNMMFLIQIPDNCHLKQSIAISPVQNAWKNIHMALVYSAQQILVLMPCLNQILPD